MGTMSIAPAHCDASPCLANSRGEQFKKITENIKGKVRPKLRFTEKQEHLYSDLS